ncbi:cadmium resistance transporter [Chryseolinea sp. H1M3-3]|uniref:cadmium resistance transporter n=1 Tax=Chryseolinea sp. H1M3-3 TaxID=3034144 RepID=UPI0023EA9B41|nr:cadmium resistance transporter [Chryseolinea sp. H1M3-3]
MEIFLASVIAFATTNIDDIFILTLFFSNPKFKVKYIVIGQYLGIILLVALSFVGSFIGLVIDVKYIGLLGLIPVYIGIKGTMRLLKQEGAETSDVGSKLQNDMAADYTQAVSVAGVTIANGGDNISIYIPLFATLAISDKIAMSVIFLMMTGLWCLIAHYLSKHPMIKGSVEKYGHIVTPVVFIFLGLYIMYESDTFSLIFYK